MKIPVPRFRKKKPEPLPPEPATRDDIAKVEKKLELIEAMLTPRQRLRLLKLKIRTRRKRA